MRTGWDSKADLGNVFRQKCRRHTRAIPYHILRQRFHPVMLPNSSENMSVSGRAGSAHGIGFEAGAVSRKGDYAHGMGFKADAVSGKGDYAHGMGLFWVEKVRGASGLEGLYVGRPTGGDVGGGRAGLDHRAKPVNTGEELEEVVPPEELIRNIQIAVGIDDIFKIDLVPPDFGERDGSKIHAVAFLVLERRGLRAWNAARGE